MHLEGWKPDKRKRTLGGLAAKIERTNNATAAEQLRAEAQRLLAPLAIRAACRAELWQAFQVSPDGVERCVLRAKAVALRKGIDPAGVLVRMIRDGDHMADYDPAARIPTGWRWTHTLQAGTYVEDPEGTDPLPPGYDLTSKVVYTEYRTFPDGSFGPVTGPDPVEAEPDNDTGEMGPPNEQLAEVWLTAVAVHESNDDSATRP